MTTIAQSSHVRGALIFAMPLAALLTLSACNGGGVQPSATSNPGGGSGGGGSGGGGTTVTATPYLLYASNYQVFPTGGTSATNSAYLASIQGGNVYAGESTPDVIYGGYSASQQTINQTQFYNIQFQWTVAGGNAADYAYVAIVPPGSGPAYTSLTRFDISQAGNLLIQMGNTYTQSDNPPGTVGGNATVFTVSLSNDTSLAQDGSGATASCSIQQPLVTVGRNNPNAINGNSATPAPLGVYNYEIPLKNFTTCTKGSIETLQSSGVTSVAIKIIGNENPNIVANELDTIAVGYVGFTM